MPVRPLLAIGLASAGIGVTLAVGAAPKAAAAPATSGTSSTTSSHNGSQGTGAHQSVRNSAKATPNGGYTASPHHRRLPYHAHRPRRVWHRRRTRGYFPPRKHAGASRITGARTTATTGPGTEHVAAGGRQVSRTCECRSQPVIYTVSRFSAHRVSAATSSRRTLGGIRGHRRLHAHHRVMAAAIASHRDREHQCAGPPRRTSIRFRNEAGRS